MSSLYTNEIRQYLHTRHWPQGVVWEIVEFEDCLKLRLYRDNINALDSDRKLWLANIVNEVLSSINKNGIPAYVWVAKGDGRNVTA